MDTALGNSPDMHYTAVSIMFGIGLFTLWLLLAGYSIRDLSARAILTITGHLRTRPDPWLESALRAAFADFDRELAVILQDRGSPVWGSQPGSSSGPAEPPSPGIG